MTKPPIEPIALPAMVVVHDTLQSCPYLPDQSARMPLRWPVGKVSEEQFEHLLAAGYRRSGSFLYRTQCPACTACHPTRVPVRDFRWSTSMRRVLRRGDAAMQMRRGLPTNDLARVALFNLHNRERGLDVRKQGPADADEYQSFLVESCCPTEELSYWIDDTLVGVAIVDFATHSLSAVYCFFNPDESRLSIGTYSILKQIQLAEQTDRAWVYLGLYVAENQHLSYKARFVPQQRLIDEKWIDFTE